MSAALRRAEGPRIKLDAAYLALRRRRLLREMAALTRDDIEDFQRVTEEWRKFHSLVHAAGQLPPSESFGVIPNCYLIAFQKTPEHKNFDSVRTYHYHQTSKSKKWKAEYNKTYYTEVSGPKRKTPEARAEEARKARLRRRQQAWVEARGDLREGYLVGLTGGPMLHLWSEARRTYEAAREAGVEGFTCEWTEFQPRLVAWLEEAVAKVTILRRDEPAEDIDDEAPDGPEPEEDSLDGYIPQEQS